ncbi:hypothetical protein RRG08_014357 [Elysia crispata]|uniref:Uncharacterized protein n=1 Tax=Elysia crispata TaxID=231223 RepID=A0AAE0XNV0_9GAST|nr:hypothetical protein RRG08_014357 [Elysia crispata]
MVRMKRIKYWLPSLELQWPSPQRVPTMSLDLSSSGTAVSNSRSGVLGMTKFCNTLLPLMVRGEKHHMRDTSKFTSSVKHCHGYVPCPESSRLTPIVA